MPPNSLLDPIPWERAFRALIWRYRPPRLQQGVTRMMRGGVMPEVPAEEAVETLRKRYARVRQHTIDFLLRRRQRLVVRLGRPGHAVHRAIRDARLLLDEGIPRMPAPEDADFHCDSGLGGLARWLRAAGYDTRFWPHIGDNQLLVETIHSSAILLTTDSPLMHRTAITWGLVPALLVPLNVGKQGQFRYVSQRLSLPRQTPRCMACGGELLAVDKTAVKERIPPRTYPWLDEYYLCRRCGKLFWPGTHWQRVERRLAGE